MKRGTTRRNRKARPALAQAGVEPLAPESEPVIEPAIPRDPAQTDIERADEHKGGSIESLPTGETIGGFLETPQDTISGE